MKSRLQFFDSATIEMIGKKAGVALRRFGAYTRTVAKNSLKKAKRKRVADLNEYERVNRLIRMRMAKSKGTPRPKLPFESSAPGELPRVRNVKRYGGKSPLKNLILYGYDKDSQSVVVGPAIFKSSAKTKGIGALEKGGTVRTKRRPVKIKARPFMLPAMEKSLPRIMEGFK